MSRFYPVVFKTSNGWYHIAINGDLCFGPWKTRKAALEALSTSAWGEATEEPDVTVDVATHRCGYSREDPRRCVICGRRIQVGGVTVRAEEPTTLTPDELMRLRELADEPMLPLASDGPLLRKVHDRLFTPLTVFDTGQWPEPQASWAKDPVTGWLFRVSWGTFGLTIGPFKNRPHD